MISYFGIISHQSNKIEICVNFLLIDFLCGFKLEWEAFQVSIAFWKRFLKFTVGSLTFADFNSQILVNKIQFFSWN